MADKKKVKLNDKVNNKKVKKDKFVSEETNEVKRFIFILISIIVVIVAVYGISKLLIKSEEVESDEPTPGVVDYDLVTVGTMLGVKDKEYYVAIYDAENPQAVLFSTIINGYLSKETALNVYFCDLGNKLNERFISKDGKTNPKAKKIEDLALGEVTLIKVKDGKIVKYVETLDTIKKELSL